MKTRLLNVCRNQLFLLSVLGLFAASTQVALGQAKPDKKEAEIKKCEMALKTAQNNLAKAEKAAALSDSLVETGTQNITDGKSEVKQIEAERKALDKEYAVAVKPLNKQLGSKDKETVTQAKAELKAIDTKYKADLKALDMRFKEATKKMTAGEMSLTKGKGSKKMNADALARAQQGVEVAQAKLDAAQGVEPAEPEKGKKGKKK